MRNTTRKEFLQTSAVLLSAALTGTGFDFKKDKTLSNILLSKNIARLIKKTEKNARTAIKLAVQSKIPVTGLASAIGYFDAYCSAIMPTNLIQAQRDFFGAHTYQRIDKEGIFHTEWNEEVVQAEKRHAETENPQPKEPEKVQK